MRISGGTLRGRRLHSPAGEKTRPTSDLLRQALFNVLGERIRDARVLDLYAGSGALGIEALSRGAATATFVEADRTAAACLGRNLDALALSDRSRLIVREVFRALRDLAQAGETFTCVLIDPPYGEDLAPRTIEALAPGPVLSENALLVVQAFHKTPLPERTGTLVMTWDRRYGESRLTVYERT
jgi:16S rRNA (guanine(966)-N(2))-methyltransferase RsmD